MKTLESPASLRSRSRHLVRTKALALALALVLGVLVCGCSSTTSRGQAPSSSGDSAVTAPSDNGLGAGDPQGGSEGPDTTHSGASTLDVAFTSPDGWTYSATLPLPTASLSAGKDIASSPPGFAKLVTRLTVKPAAVEEETLTDTNVGRPSGPRLSLSPGVFVFPVGGGLVDRIDDSMLEQSGDASIGNPQIGQCTLFPPYGGDLAWWPEGSGALYCSAASGSGRSDYSADEALVDQLVAALQGVEPIYVVNWEQNGSSACNVAVFPTGRVQLAPDYSADCPSKLSLTASRGNS